MSIPASVYAKHGRLQRLPNVTKPFTNSITTRPRLPFSRCVKLFLYFFRNLSCTTKPFDLYERFFSEHLLFLPFIMRISNTPAEAALLSTLLFPVLAAAVGNIDCNHVRVDKTSFDLSQLGGPRSVLHSVDQGVSLLNTTYTIDICRPLTRAADVPKEQQCPGGTRGRTIAHESRYSRER